MTILAPHLRIEWRYLSGGAAVHALTSPDVFSAVCGRHPSSACQHSPCTCGWMGTGSQREYEAAERLPRCKQCVAKVGAR